MVRLDLDDLPPNMARALERLSAGEELLLVRAGAVVARLAVAQAAAAPASTDAEEPGAEGMAEILDHFSSIINEEF
ncbi:MAG TPA: hypothetical protein VGS12_08535 [Caulobacteraceae bacterium]|nr:hypothetical protein [Caulobacteraceae bacterium]